MPRALVPLIAAAWLVLLSSGRQEARATASADRAYIAVGQHSEAVHRAMRLLDAVLRSEEAERCSDYFEEHGWSVTESLANGSPLVITTNVQIPGPKGVYAAIRPESPWTVIHLNPETLSDSAWPRLDDCTLASLILHEMGHLARRDTKDRESKEFFRRCRLRCVDPGRWK